MYNLLVIDEELRRELLDMRAEVMRVRQELLESGELGGSYAPQMEAMHVRNASRLRELIAAHGWPVRVLRARMGPKRHGSSSSMQSVNRSFSGKCCACWALVRVKNVFLFGTQHIWKIGLRCMRADRKFTVPIG
jgi:hypothetical protein